MRTIKIGRRIVNVTFMLTLIETSYFGWNRHPITSLEQYIDWILLGTMFIGFGIAMYGFHNKTKQTND